MSRRRGTLGRPWPGSPGWVVLLVLAVPVSVAVWLGCAVTPENYATLSFFFDGVPDPSVQVVSADGTVVAGGTSVAFVHKPYLEQQCDACHKSELRFTRRDASGCLSCHEGVADAHRYMHGPVAAHACLWCHTPHESAFPHLLRETDRQLCTRCHSASLLSTERVPEHADAARACLECHGGHGGPERFMLRTNAAIESGPPAEER